MTYKHSSWKEVLNVELTLFSIFFVDTKISKLDFLLLILLP